MRKNQNELFLEEDTLISTYKVSTCPHPQILSWLHIDVQRLKIRSIALTIAFSEQMYQVANTVAVRGLSFKRLLHGACSLLDKLADGCGYLVRQQIGDPDEPIRHRLIRRSAQSCHVHDRSDRTHGPVAPH